MKDLASTLGCRPFNVPAYLTLLKTLSIKNKSLKMISRELGWADSTVFDKVGLMEEKGFLKSLRSGRSRIIALTEEGKRVLEGVRE